MFEPRLKRVVVRSEEPEPTQRALRFRIDAILDVAPVQAPVSFDTVMELNGQTQVNEA
jgi:type VI secretion system protein ImpF